MRISNSPASTGIQLPVLEQSTQAIQGQQLQSVSAIHQNRKSRYIAAGDSQQFLNTTTYSRRKKVNAPHSDELRKNLKIIQNSYRNWKEQNFRAPDLSAQRFVDLHPSVKSYLDSFYKGPVEAILHPYL